MNIEMKRFFGTAGQVNINQKSTQFVDQSINLVKHILELSQEPDNLSLLSDFEPLLDSFVKYVSRLLPDETTYVCVFSLCLRFFFVFVCFFFRNNLSLRSDFEPLLDSFVKYVSRLLLDETTYVCVLFFMFMFIFVFVCCLFVCFDEYMFVYRNLNINKHKNSVRIKKTSCALIEAMMTKRKHISFINELKFRTSLVDSVMAWTSDIIQGVSCCVS
jgi:hypothetical protein